MTAPWHYGRSTQNSEEMLSRLYRRLKVSNHIPSRYEAWEDGDYLLQMVDFIAHALLKQEEGPVPRAGGARHRRSLPHPGCGAQRAGVWARSTGGVRR